jgi:hypothetical protein
MKTSASKGKLSILRKPSKNNNGSVMQSPINDTIKIQSPESIKSKIKNISVSKSSNNINHPMKSSLNSNKKLNYTKSQNNVFTNKECLTSREKLNRTNSLKPFPKLDHEFYEDKPNYFWNKELTRVNTESSIFKRQNSERKNFNSQMMNFGKVLL